MDYWPLFEKFCRAEMATGGPDPQIKTILHIVKSSKHNDDTERAWMAGCYGAHHSVGSAVAIWERWRPLDVIQGQYDLMMWLNKHWDYLPVRPEMRSHRMLEKRTECLVDFAYYSLARSWEDVEDFEVLWKDAINEVKYFGRYMCIKFMEIGYQAEIFRPVMPDMRARGAWSPRRALGLLFPHEPLLSDRDDTSEEGHTIMETCATLAMNRLRQAGLDVNYFKLQVMLCEFREALDGTYYPGASLDEELGFLSKTTEMFDMTSVYEARRALFNDEHLGEIGGWGDVRPEKYEEFK